jgi:hypothetical protein
MGHGVFRTRTEQKGMNQPVGITTLPLRSAEGRNHPRPCHHPSALRDPLASEHHAERARPVEQRYRHGGRTDRKASVGPSIDRNSCGGDNSHIREQDIGLQPLRHCSEARWVEVCRLLRWGRRIGGNRRWVEVTLSAYTKLPKDKFVVFLFLSTSDLA